MFQMLPSDVPARVCCAILAHLAVPDASLPLPLACLPLPCLQVAALQHVTSGMPAHAALLAATAAAHWPMHVSRPDALAFAAGGGAGQLAAGLHTMLLPDQAAVQAAVQAAAMQHQLALMQVCGLGACGSLAHLVPHCYAHHQAALPTVHTSPLCSPS